ncbi:MAG: phosphodiester glycosidase family protein [Candidatus Marinimicrobia bacterium]|nr:phosphodiester glycosidase family protein [Candidatus Neomarinimicrobiota bacterium]
MTIGLTESKANYSNLIKILYCVITLFIFFDAALLSQNRTTTSSEWKAIQLADGITWKSKHYTNLYNSNQSINILDIDLNTPDVITDIVYDKNKRVRTSKLVESHTGAIAAVNGSFFDMKNGGSVVFLQSDSELIDTTEADAPPFITAGAVGVDLDGDMLIIDQRDQWSQTDSLEDILVTGPMLLDGGQTVESDEIDFNLTRHPRTAIGITRESILLAVTVDGRTAQAAGMSIPELAEFMQRLGCVDAINLDGGGSTTMWIRGRGVVNYPSDNGEFDHKGEREVANCIVVKIK